MIGIFSLGGDSERVIGISLSLFQHGRVAFLSHKLACLIVFLSTYIFQGVNWLSCKKEKKQDQQQLQEVSFSSNDL